ncbi:MAG: carbohydrate porin [Rhodospirillales bacterium]|nr:MAG: carbohydrate porin [Rhodospirillales bacterium]
MKPQRNRYLPTLLFAAALLLSFAATAQEADTTSRTSQSGFEDIPSFGGPSSVGEELREGDALTDPIFRWDGLERALQPYFGFKGQLHEDHAFSFGLDYQALVQAVNESLGEDSAAGGIFRLYGSWTLAGRESGNTGSLVFKVENRHRLGTDVAPQNLGFEAGALSITGTMFSDYDWGLTNLYWQQKFADGRFGFVAGQVDVTDYLDIYGLINPLTAFQNLSFSTNPTIPAPSQGLGAAAGTFFGDNLYGVLGFADANGDPTDPSLDLFDDFETFQHLEFGYASSFDRRYFDNIHLTIWHSDERTAAGVPEDAGLALSASWFFENKWVPFLRAGWSDGDAALMSRNVAAGFGYLARNRDLFGLGLAWERPGASALDDQYTAELFYRFQLFQNFAITPDVQVIANPALNPFEDVIYVLGLRARLTL